MRRARWLFLFLLSGCVSVSGLERSAMEHEGRARQFAEVGKGQAAAQEANAAVSDREAARRRADKRSGYWEAEVLME